MGGTPSLPPPQKKQQKKPVLHLEEHLQPGPTVLVSESARIVFLVTTWSRTFIHHSGALRPITPNSILGVLFIGLLVPVILMLAISS